MGSDDYAETACQKGQCSWRMLAAGEEVQFLYGSIK
jgi:hypothetical protein